VAVLPNGILELLSADVTAGLTLCVVLAQPTPAVTPTTSTTEKRTAAP